MPSDLLKHQPYITWVILLDIIFFNIKTFLNHCVPVYSSRYYGDHVGLKASLNIF